MNRVTSWMASGLLTISAFLGVLTAQEPKKGQPGGPQAGSGEPAKAKDQARAEATKAKAAADEEPVVTHHRIRIGGEELAYTATAGLMPIKDDKGETEARIFFMAYTRDDAGPVDVAAAHVQLQRRAGLGVGLAAPGRPRAAAGGRPRRAGDPGAAVPPGRQRSHLARPHRPGLHRPGRHRVLPRGQARAQRQIPRAARRHRIGRRVHPDVPDALRPLVVAAIPDRRELRHDPRRRAGRAPGRPRHRLQRRDPGVLRPGFPGVRLQPRQRPVRS